MYGPARKVIPSHPVFNKTLPYQRGRKMYLNSCWPSPFIRTYKASQNFWPNASHAGDMWHPYLAWALNVTELELTKPNSCNRILKMHLNTWWSNSSHARKDTKCFWTCVDQTPIMPQCTQNAYQLVLTIPQNVIKITKCISTCNDENLPMPGRTQNASQHVFTKPIP